MTTITWHRPLIALAALMAVLTVAISAAAIFDPREVLGANLWFKPLKFALSIGIYALTLAWLIGQLHTLRRAAWIAGTVSAIGLAIEMVIIVVFAAIGETSHFNVATPLHTVMWSVMASSIVVVWLMVLVVAIALFRSPRGDAARTLAIRAGVVLAMVGMGLAFFMTSPTSAQLSDFQGVAGAHAVGIADGGPGLPILGWSTVAGDLRVPHFIGMHALQILPLLVLGLELVARRLPAMSAHLRHQLVRIAVPTFAATLVLLTWQALAGQSVVRPEGAVLWVGMLIAVAALEAVAFTVWPLVTRSRAASRAAATLT